MGVRILQMFVRWGGVKKPAKAGSVHPFRFVESAVSRAWRVRIPPFPPKLPTLSARRSRFFYVPEDLAAK